MALPADSNPPEALPLVALPLEAPLDARRRVYDEPPQKLTRITDSQVMKPIMKPMRIKYKD